MTFRRFAPLALGWGMVAAISGCGDDRRGGSIDAGPIGFDVVIPSDAPPVDTGMRSDTGPGIDAGPPDGGQTPDAGPRDGGPGVDAGPRVDAGRDAGPPPAGDSCAAPIDLNAEASVGAGGVLSFIGTTVGATDDYEGSCGSSGGPDVVFVYRAPSDGVLTLSTDHPTTEFDTVLHVRSTCDDSESELQCDDDGGDGTRSKVAVTVTGGTDLFIVVDGYDDFEAGAFELTAQLRARRAEGEACDTSRLVDFCEPGTLCVATSMGAPTGTCEAVDLGCGLGVDVVDLTGDIEEDAVDYSGDTSLGVATTDGSCDGDEDPAPEQVHKLVLPYAAAVNVEVSADFDPHIYVRTDCGSDTTEVACDSGFVAELTYDAIGEHPAGTTLYIYVDGETPADAGFYELFITLRRSLAEGEMCEPDPLFDEPRCGPGLACREEAGGGVCRMTNCGDGLVEGHEECEPAPGCTAMCELEDAGSGGDACGGAVPLYLVETSSDTWIARATGTTVGANDDFGSGLCDAGLGAPDVIYYVDLPMPGDLFVTLDPIGGFDPIIYMRSADCGVGEELDCDSFGGVGSNEYLSEFDLEAGRYYIFVDGDSAGAAESGAYSIELEFGPPF